MRTRPADLSDDQVAEALWRGWGVSGTTLTYAPVGFGDHHWLATVADGPRLFLTVSRPGGGRGRAFLTAEALRHEAGLEFVIAPVQNVHGGVVAGAGRGFVMTVTTWVEHAVDDAEPGVVVALAARLHGATHAVRDIARADDLSIEARDGLEAALVALDLPWDGGPYADDVRLALRAGAERVRAALAEYDRLLGAVRRRNAPFVVTHGELKAGNVLSTPAGPAVVDWDTARLAPPERDLWRLTDPDDLATYSALTGHAVDPDALALYRARWDLTDIALYVAQLRTVPERTADTEIAWQELRRRLGD